MENLIREKNSDDARFVLGRLLLEGSSDKIKRNDAKGMNWVKEAVANGHIDALEFKTFFDIRFDTQPKVSKIFKNLEIVIEKTKSLKCCNMLGEFNQSQDKTEGYQEVSARYYNMSAEQGCQVGIHWLGVFYRVGFGV